MEDVIRHLPSWTEDYGRSNDKQIAFTCDNCSHNVVYVDRKRYEAGKETPPTAPHFPH